MEKILNELKDAGYDYGVAIARMNGILERSVQGMRNSEFGMRN